MMISLVLFSMEFWLLNDWLLLLGVIFGCSEYQEYWLQIVIVSGIVIVIDVCYCNESCSYELGVEGLLFWLLVGDVCLVVGVGYCENIFCDVDCVVVINMFCGYEGVCFGYVEFNLLLIVLY